MKINKWLAFASTAALLCSCADDFDTNDFVAERPGDAAQYDYLKEYGSLKEYADELRKTYPNMKIGVTVSPDELNAKTSLYAVVASNFDEVSSAGMQQSDFVTDDAGTMDFGKVSTLASAAKDAELSVFGASLLNNGAQKTSWFDALVNGTTSKDIVEVKSEGIQGWEVQGPVDVTLIAREAGAADVADNFVTVDGRQCIVLTSNANPSQTWDTQFFIGTPGKVWAGGENYHISFWYKASAETGSETQCHGSSAGAYIHWAMLPSNPSFTTEWQKYDTDGTIPAEGDGMQYIAFNLATSSTPVTFYFSDVVWEGNQLLTERTINLVNPHMEEGKSMENFVVREYGNADKFGDILVGQGPNGKNCTVVHAKDMVEQAWDTQFFITYVPNTGDDAEFKFEGDTEVHFSMWVKAAHDGKADTQCHNGCGGYIHWACLPDFPGFTTEWTLYEKTFNFPAEGAGMNTIAFNLNTDAGANDYYFADINWEVTQKATAGSTFYYVYDVIKNGNMAGDNFSNFLLQGGIDGYAQAPGIPAPNGPEGANCISITSKSDATAGWDTQLFITSNTLWNAGDEYTFEADIKASKEASAGTQAHMGPGEYLHWEMIGNLNFTTEWKHVKVEGKIPSACSDGMRTIAVNLNDVVDEITYEFANISWIRTEKLDDAAKGQRALTDEEKSTAVNEAFTSWINKATSGISAGMKEIILLDKPITNNVAGFDYDKYLESDHVKMAHDLAREAYLKADTVNNKAEDLKLYVNEVLDAAVVEALKDKLEAWNEAGIQIDGISVEYTAQAGATEPSEVAALFKSVNALGLPVRVSALTVSGSTETFDDLKNIEDTYKIVIAAYVANISSDNQRGIILSNYDNLWQTKVVDDATLFINRLPGYAGVAEGLKANK